MSHEQVFKAFKSLFPDLIRPEVVYFQNGRNSIRLRGLKAQPYPYQDMVFTYQSDKIWKFETVSSFLETMKANMKGESK